MTATAMLMLRRTLDALQRQQSVVVGVASLLLVWLILRIAVRDSHTRRAPQAPRRRVRPGTPPRARPQPAAAPAPEPAPLQPPPAPEPQSPEPQSPQSPEPPTVPPAAAVSDDAGKTTEVDAGGYAWR
jgi:type IV secretory pathway VirB10-like protein